MHNVLDATSSPFGTLRRVKPLQAFATRAEAVTAQLRNEILNGSLRPGTRLLQQEVAKQLGVSTTPVREAFAALQREGLLKGDAHKGVEVSLPTLEELRENYEIRIALESLAAGFAAELRTEADLADLRVLLSEMGRTTSTVDYLPLNHRFHMRIYQAAQRPQLTTLIEGLRNAAGAYTTLFTLQVPDSTETQAQHERIFDALLARDAAATRQAMADHLNHTLEVVSERISNSPVLAR
jgi:DNA-binding GntR family transcriptional regulator